MCTVHIVYIFKAINIDLFREILRLDILSATDLVQSDEWLLDAFGMYLWQYFNSVTLNSTLSPTPHSCLQDGLHKEGSVDVEGFSRRSTGVRVSAIC